MKTSKEQFQEMRENDMFFSTENPYYIEEMERLNTMINIIIEDYGC